MAASENEQAVVQDEHMYEVEKLTGFRKLKNGKCKYWVRWKGYGPKSDTLEPEENLFGCEDMIEDLHTKKAKSKRKSKSKAQRDRRDTKMQYMNILGNKSDCDKKTEPESYTEECSSCSSKDTYWRDFDEGRIDVCNSQDMYSKVKERAARSILQNDSKKLTVNIHSRENEELSPKVVIKHSVSSKSRSDDDTCKPPVKVRPTASVSLKRSKKCAMAVGYKKRRLKKKRVHHVDEKQDMEALNIKARTSLADTKMGKISLECSGTEIQNSSGCSKVLQELTGILGNKRDCDKKNEPESMEECSSRSSKDTYWRDFDEGRIDVCNSQDMYSKVKERAARSILQNDSKKLTVNIHSRESEELSPKVVIKRSVSSKSRSDDDTCKPPVKVRPTASVSLKRSKKCAMAVGYKKRRLKKKRMHHVDENKHVDEKQDMEALNIKPRTLYATKTGKVSLECSGTEIQNSSGCSKVLQELTVNDDGLGQDFTFSLLNSKQNMFDSELPVVQSSKESKVYDDAQLVKADPELIKTELDGESKGIFSEESKELAYSDALSCKVSSNGINIGVCGTSSESMVYSSVNKMRQATLQKRKFDLWDVIKKEDHDHLRKLLNCGIKWDLEETDSQGLTLLMTAASNGSVEAVKILCANGASINATNSSGTTALMLVCEKGEFDIAKTLLELNAHKDIQNNNGETALMLACQHCKPKIVELLLQYGANFGLTNKDGINAFRISNHCAKDSITPILNLHISRIMMVFEDKAKEVVQDIAEVKYALFPIQCFSLNEGPTFRVTFQHRVKKELPEKGYLLFIAHTSIDLSSIICSFQGVSSVLSARVNGYIQESLRKDDNYVFKMSSFVSGNNEVLITTAHNAQSEVKLVVCAYRVYYKLNDAQSDALDSSQSNSDPLSSG